MPRKGRVQFKFDSKDGKNVLNHISGSGVDKKETANTYRNFDRLPGAISLML